MWRISSPALLLLAGCSAATPVYAPYADLVECVWNSFQQPVDASVAAADLKIRVFNSAQEYRGICDESSAACYVADHDAIYTFDATTRRPIWPLFYLHEIIHAFHFYAVGHADGAHSGTDIWESHGDPASIENVVRACYFCGVNGRFCSVCPPGCELQPLQ